MDKGFDELKDLVDDSTESATYKHIYRTNYDGTWKKHMCLQWGAWCWKQALARPLDIRFYLRKRLR